MCSPLSHLSIDASTAHVDTISLVKFTFAQRLSKMVGRSVENEIEIRADIKTRALLSRGSTDIYADICTVMLVIQCHFPQFADRLGISVQV